MTSFALLPPALRQGLRGLSLCVGGFSAEAAQGVAGLALEDLARLVDRSLVRAVSPGRYDLHETSRAYAHACLKEREEEASALEERFARFYLQIPASCLADTGAHREAQVVARVGAELENIRRAWEIAIRRRDFTMLAEAVDGVYRATRHPGRDAEGHDLLWSLVEALEALPTRTEALERLLVMARVRLGHF